MRETRPTVVIIGAGFSDTALAANLLRAKVPVRVVLVNRYGPMGRGVAFGTRLEAHLLNVRVGLMSAFPDDPEHFLRFVQARTPAPGADDYVPRSVYGEYLEEVLDEARRHAVPESTLECVVGEAVALEHPARGTGLDVRFADGTRRRADRVALALGKYPGTRPGRKPAAPTARPLRQAA